MSLVPPTVAQLATFTGRQTSDFTSFAVQALGQATLLFYLATGLNEYPEDDNLEQLAYNGIMDMADNIYSSQPYREATASPYSSETIGSYSYTKTLKSVKKGDATGIMWFDLAVNELKTNSQGIVSSGSIEGMEWDGLETTDSGRYKIAGASSGFATGRESWAIDTTVTEQNPYYL